MEFEKVDFHQLPFSELFRDYINGKEDTQPFFAYRHVYHDLKKAVSSYRYTGDRKRIAAIAEEFNRDFPLEKTAKENLRALEDDNTVTITTGQQVSVYGGPLYTVFKTITVILLAKRLSHDTGKRVVPVFWLADEDHDYEEISTIALPVNQEMVHVALPCDSCARHAAGSIPVEENGFTDFRDEVFEHLASTDFHQDLRKLMDECYVPGRTLRRSFGVLLTRLFSRYGLILTGSNFPEAKAVTRDTIKTAITRADDIESVLNQQSNTISAKYHQQAHISDSLLFWHDDRHGRVRLVHQNGTWSREPNVQLTSDELLRELDDHPERFSPNVFLRPLLQDKLLPNAAYVGGPAEIAYYGQMKPLYDLFNLDMPFIAGRFSGTLVEPSVMRLLKDLPYSFSDFSQRYEDLEQNFLRKQSNPNLDADFDRWKKQIEELTDKMTAEIGIEDPGLKKHSHSITREHIKAIDKLRKKVVNSIRQKEEIQINRLKKVKFALFPNDRLQEREISFLYYMNKFGLDIWDRMLESLEDEEDVLYSRHYYISL